MLFDLKGKRKRFIQVTYVGLAFLFAVGLVGFGIGGGTSGGFLDALKGGGGGGSSSSNDVVRRYLKAAALHPKSEKVWLDLLRAEYSVATSGDNYDRNANQFTEGAKKPLESASRAWSRYLALKPKKPDASAALIMVQVEGALLQVGPASVIDTLRQARRAQEIAVEARPNPNGYFVLARINYFLGEVGRGDKAARKAIEGTPKDQRNTLRAQLKDDKQQGLKAKKAFQKQTQQAEKQARSQIKKGQDPFGTQPGQTSLGP